MDSKIQYNDLCGCPICGERPIVEAPDKRYHALEWIIFHIDPEPTDDCPIGTYRPFHYCAVSGETYQEAAQRWNNRTVRYKCNIDIEPNKPFMIKWIINKFRSNRVE